MKLFSRYNTLSLSAASVIFVFTIAALYFIFRQVLIQQLDQSLLGEKSEIIQFVTENNALPETENVYGERIDFEVEKSAFTEFKFKTKHKEMNSDEDELVRVMYFGVDVNGKHYKVSVMRSLNETNRLLLYIIIVMIGAILLMLLIWFFINRFFVKRLLRPFYSTLSKIEDYELSDKQQLHLEPTNIYEFKLLNEKIVDFSSRIIKDYSVLKDFTENAAHEMQTPLSVIRTHTDNLLQNANLSLSEMESLHSIEGTIHKLSKLNQSLLLLVKLESNSTIETSLIQVNEKIDNKCSGLSEIIAAKKITLNKKLEPLPVNINEQLLDIIINNLLNNAIKYNTDNGTINIITTANQFSIANTSYLGALEETQIFQRFYRHPSAQSEGTGLGLAIVKQAVSVSGFSIKYFYKDQLHTYVIDFSGKV